MASILLLALALGARAVELEPVPESPAPLLTPRPFSAALPQNAEASVPPEAVLPIQPFVEPQAVIPPAHASLTQVGQSLQRSESLPESQRGDAQRFTLDESFDLRPTLRSGGLVCAQCAGFDSADVDAFRESEPFDIPERLEQDLPSRRNDRDWTKETSLHAHSHLSDGTMTPEAVVERAAREGVKKLALSDHDTVAGVQRAYRKAKELGLDFHPSAELTARGGVHVGAVDIDAFNPKLTALLARVRAARYKHAEEMAKYLNSDELLDNLEELARNWSDRPRAGLHELEFSEGAPRGPPAESRGNLAQKALEAARAFRERGGTITIEQIVAESKYEEGGTIEFPHIARALRTQGLLENVDDAFDTFFKKLPAMPDVPPDPAAKEVVDAVHAAGGKAFLNHPYTVRGRSDAERDRRIRVLLQDGFDGIEVYRPSNATSPEGRRRADERVAKYLSWAEELGLIVGNGADFHGDDTHLNHIVVWMPRTHEATLTRALDESRRRAVEVLERAERRPRPGVPALLPPLLMAGTAASKAPAVLLIAMTLAFVGGFSYLVLREKTRASTKIAFALMILSALAFVTSVFAGAFLLR